MECGSNAMLGEAIHFGARGLWQELWLWQEDKRQEDSDKTRSWDQALGEGQASVRLFSFYISKSDFRLFWHKGI